jgi:Cu(I)/Ag(I) efflux system periplasmic protein CusF
MKYRFLVRAALVITLGLPPMVAGAQTDDFVNGLVTKIDESAGRFVIKHGPIKKVQYGGDDDNLQCCRPHHAQRGQPGDKVRFVPDRINGHFTITTIEKAK